MNKILGGVIKTMAKEQGNINRIPTEEFRAYKFGFLHGTIAGIILSGIIVSIIYFGWLR